jgi:hypothetical protein
VLHPITDGAGNRLRQLKCQYKRIIQINGFRINPSRGFIFFTGESERGFTHASKYERNIWDFDENLFSQFKAIELESELEIFPFLFSNDFCAFPLKNRNTFAVQRLYFAAFSRCFRQKKNRRKTQMNFEH